MIGIFGYRWIHRVMQATAVLVGAALVIMLAQGLRYGALPARQTTWAWPTSGLFMAGAALLPALGPVAAIGKVSGSWALAIMAVSLIDASAVWTSPG